LILSCIQGDDEEVTRETTSTTYELVDLVPYTEYSIRVQAVNENGPGAFSKDIVIRTHSAQPTQPPHNVTLEAASSTVYWIFEYITNESEKEILKKFYVHSMYIHF